MSPRKGKPVLAFGIAALLALILCVVATIVLYGKDIKAGADLAALEKDRAKLEQDVDAKPIAMLQEEDRKLDAQLAGINLKQAEKEYMPEFTHRIETMGLQTGVDFKELRPGEYRKGNKIGTTEGGAPIGKYGEYDITLRFSGTFGECFDTIQALGELPQMVCSNDIDIKSAKAADAAASGPSTLDTVVDLTAFVMEGGAFPGKFVAGSR